MLEPSKNIFHSLFIYSISLNGSLNESKSNEEKGIPVLNLHYTPL